MASVFELARRTLPRLLSEPVQLAKTLRNRAFAGGILYRDPAAYQIVGSWTFGDLPRVTLNEIFPGIETVDIKLMKPFERTDDTSVNLMELSMVAAIVKHLRPNAICEIGTFDGVTALNLAANAPDDARITTIDLPPDWSRANALALDIDRDHRNMTPRTKVGSQFLGTEYESKITQVFGDSAALDWSGLDGPFDLVFIDGCHAYEYVVQDTRNALSQLAPGGSLIWHDYGIMDDVSRAVDEFTRELDPVALRGTRLALSRPSAAAGA